MKKQLPLWVGLTTSPSRIDKLRPTLESLISQTVTPNRIFLSIPEFSARENRTYEIPSWLCEFQPILQILHCANDFGPGTKLLGCLRELKEPGCLVIVDDDMIYRPFFLKNLLEAQNRNLNASFSYWTYNYGPITVGQGADGFSFYTPNLRDIESYAAQLLQLPRIRVVDDLWISSYLKKQHVSVLSVRDTIPDTHDVYLVSHQDNQLQHQEGELSRNESMRHAANYLISHGHAGRQAQTIYLLKKAAKRLLGKSE